MNCVNSSSTPKSIIFLFNSFSTVNAMQRSLAWLWVTITTTVSYRSKLALTNAVTDLIRNLSSRYNITEWRGVTIFSLKAPPIIVDDEAEVGYGNHGVLA